MALPQSIARSSKCLEINLWMILDRVFPLPIQLKEADMMVLDNEGNSNGCSESFQIVSSEVFPLGMNQSINGISTDDLHRFFQYLSVAVQKRYVKPHNIKNSKNYRSDENHKLTHSHCLSHNLPMLPLLSSNIHSSNRTF